MKRFNPILLTIFLNSCVSGYHIGTGDKLNNMKHWQEDAKAKKDAKVKQNIAKFR